MVGTLLADDGFRAGENRAWIPNRRRSIYRDAQCTHAWNIHWRDVTGMGKRVDRAGVSVGRTRSRDGIERHPDRTIAGDVHLRRDAALVQFGAQRGERLRRHIGFAPEIGSVLLVGQIGIEKDRRMADHHAIDEDFGKIHAQAARMYRLAPGVNPREVCVSRHFSARKRHHHGHARVRRQLAGLVQPIIGFTVRECRAFFGHNSCIQEARHADAVKIPDPRTQRRHGRGAGDLRNLLLHRVSGPFQEQAIERPAIWIAPDFPVSRVRRILVDARDRKGARIHPAIMDRVVPKHDGMVATRLVELLESLPVRQLPI